MTATALEPAAARAGSGLRMRAIQPNLLPWLGFFGAAMQADVLVLLDDVPFSRGSYTNRVRVMGPKGPTWLTVPVRHPCSGVQIRDVEIALRLHRHEQLVAKVVGWYGGETEPHVRDLRDGILDIAKSVGMHLGRANACMLARTLAMLGIRTRLVWASSLRTHALPASCGLFQLCRAVGATTYVAGNGSGYEDLPAFEAAGIEFTRAKFRHPEYPQRRPFEWVDTAVRDAAGVEHRGREARQIPFVPGLSIVDVLANVGTERTRELLAESIE